MINIPLNQSGHSFSFETTEDYSDATSFVIKYIKPDKSKGEWDASYDGTYITKPFTEVSPGISELNMLGKWKCWPEITLSDGRRLIDIKGFVFTVFEHELN